MAPPRVLALDVDGTLLTHDGRLTPATRAAVAAARAAGVVVVLASAPPPRGPAPAAGGRELAGPLIAFGGALVRGPGGVALHERRLPLATAEAVAADARGLGLEVGWYAGG